MSSKEYLENTIFQYGVHFRFSHYCIAIVGVILYYSYIYAPAFVFLPIGLDKIVCFLGIVYVTTKKRWYTFVKIFKWELYILFLISILSFAIFIIHRKDIIFFGYDVVLILEALPTAFALWLYLKNNKIFDKKRIIVYASLIAGLLSLYLIFHPALMQHIKMAVLKYPENLQLKFLYRGYGISDGLLFSYPVIQGFVIGIILLSCKNISISQKMVTCILCILCIIVNARSGFVPVAIGFLLFIYKNKTESIKIIIIIVLSFMLLGTMLSSLIETNDMLNTAVEWSKTTIDILQDIFSGKRTENVDALTNDMLFSPTTLDEWLIGIGSNVFITKFFGKTSDIGYVIRLMYGGIVYLVGWLILMIYMFKRWYKCNKEICLLFFLSLIYLNYKSDFFMGVPASRFFFLIYAWTILDYIQKKKIINYENHILG